MTSNLAYLHSPMICPYPQYTATLASPTFAFHRRHDWTLQRRWTSPGIGSSLPVLCIEPHEPDWNGLCGKWTYTGTKVLFFDALFWSRKAICPGKALLPNKNANADSICATEKCMIDREQEICKQNSCTTSHYVMLIRFRAHNWRFDWLRWLSRLLYVATATSPITYSSSLHFWTRHIRVIKMAMTKTRFSFLPLSIKIVQDMAAKSWCHIESKSAGRPLTEGKFRRVPYHFSERSWQHH